MYNAFYHFTAPPFENTADPRLFYASEQHREALAAIEYTIRMRKGVVLITGDIGAGKTMVTQAMIERCRQRATVIELVQGLTGGSVLIRHLLRSMAIEPRRGDDQAQLTEQLIAAFQDRAAAGVPVVLFMDEAQALSDSVLEQLRLLSNVEAHLQKLLQLVLVGQPELRQRISQPALAALRQRIVLARQLRPLNVVETSEYVQHRLKQNSENPDQVRVAFTGSAIETLYGFSRGLPRLINVVCESCLLLGFVKQAREIDAAIVNRVLEDMMPNFQAPTPQQEIKTHAPLSLAGSF